MTAESYRFFIENAYNQFLQHGSFHTSVRSKTKAKDIGASGFLHTSTKLSGYVWLGSDTKLVHVPEDQAGDVQMDADDEVDEGAVFRSRFNKMIKMKFRKKFKKNLKMKNNNMMKFMKRFKKNSWKV